MPNLAGIGEGRCVILLSHEHVRGWDIVASMIMVLCGMTGKTVSNARAWWGVVERQSE